MAKILIAGGSGLIGRELVKLLRDEGFDVFILSRNPKENQFYWNIEKGEIDRTAFENTEVIINLSGENIGEKRWTKAQKQKIFDSRVKSTELLFTKVKEYNSIPKVLISASAIGFYGAINSEKIFAENDEAGTDFLANVCKAWEEKVFEFEKMGTRVVILRTAVVLAKNGGALARMLPLAKNHISTQLGNGKQFMPWIHIDDLYRIYLFAIKNSINGIFNAVAPEHTTNNEFAETLATAVQRKIWTPAAPAFILKIVLGEMAEILLNGSRISANKIRNADFQFTFPNLKDALRNIVDT
ncbi:MAG TPA: TIGR01777 family oxidoreductase [Chitinophagales bacterium]